MTWRTGMVCAAALLAAVGCTPTSFLAPFAGPPPPTYVATGSVGVVSAILQENLAQAGIPVFVKRSAEEVRLVGQTRSNRTFSLCLRPAKADHGDRTTVVLVWSGEPDRQVWGMVLDALKPPASTTTTDAPHTKSPTAAGPSAE